jgi:galactoside O-acetyltransferase
LVLNSYVVFTHNHLYFLRLTACREHQKFRLRSIRMQDENAATCSQLADHAARSVAQGDYKEAARALYQSLTRQPESATINFAVAKVLHQSGDNAGALIFYARAALLNPLNRDAIVGTAETYAISGDKAAARAVLSLSSRTHLTPGTEHTIPPPNLHGSWAECAAYLRIGQRVLLAPESACDVRYRPHAPSGCVSIGDESVILGTLAIIRHGGVIQIGRRSWIDTALISATDRITIGDDVVIDAGVTVWDNDSHSLVWEERLNDVIQCGLDWVAHPTDFIRNKDWSNVAMSPIIICDRAWIGFNSIILKGVTVGEGAVVLPGSTVARDVPPYTVVGGAPAKVQRTLSRSDR